MNREHQYTLTVRWTGNNGSGTSGYRDYERNHSIYGEDKKDIMCSSDPVFRGDKSRYSPEELLVASISGCHMLWYLHLCADSGVIVIDYIDNPTGILSEAPDGSGKFTQVTLRPVITLSDKSMIGKADTLHKKANELCFIANSCNFKIIHYPEYKTKEN